jgi:hypothetical protein
LSVRQLAEDFAKYLYLPRLRGRELILEAVRSRLATTSSDLFAYADRYDSANSRYEGLHAGGNRSCIVTDDGLLVQPGVATQQLALVDPHLNPQNGRESNGANGIEAPPAEPPPRRFFASIEVGGDRLIKQIGQIHEEVLRHLQNAAGARVKVTLEIEAESASGFSEETRRIVAENGRTLHFRQTEFTAE